MKTSEAISLFDGSVAKLAAALEISTAAIYQWGDEVPKLRAYQIRDLLEAQKSEGAVVATDYTGPDRRLGVEPGQLIERRRADNHKEAA